LEKTVSISADTLRRLSALKLAPDAMAEVLSILADMQSVDEARKAKDRARKRVVRGHSTEIPGSVQGNGEEIPVDPSPALSPLGPPPTTPPYNPPNPTPNHEHQTARERELDFKKRLMAVYAASGVLGFPDGGYVAVWLARGHNPEICLAVVAEGLKSKGRFVPPKYFDQAIADAHVAPVGQPGKASQNGYKSPVAVNRGQWIPESSDGGKAWLSRYPGVWKSKREERNGEWGAMLPSEFPPANGAAA
jgi:hypothetical protein